MLLALEKDADEKGTVELDPNVDELRFGHYQVLQRDDGRPLSWAAVRWGSRTRHLMSIFTAR